MSTKVVSLTTERKKRFPQTSHGSVNDPIYGDLTLADSREFVRINNALSLEARDIAVKKNAERTPDPFTVLRSLPCAIQNEDKKREALRKAMDTFTSECPDQFVSPTGESK